MSVSSTLDLGFQDGEVRDGQQHGSGIVHGADDDRLAFLDVAPGHDAVDGRGDGHLRQVVARAVERRPFLEDALRRPLDVDLACLELGLAKLDLGRRLLVDLAGDEAQRPQVRLPLQVLAGDLEVDAGGLHGDLRLLVGRGGRLEGRLAAVDDRLQVLGIDLQQELPGGDPFALVHREARDPPHRAGAHVDRQLRLNGAGSGDYRDQVAPFDRLDVHLRRVGALEQEIDGDERGAGEDDESPDEKLSRHVQKPRLVRSTAMIRAMPA